jgi:rfaE bifunctional protein nucleotidyltransferase chain/domain
MYEKKYPTVWINGCFDLLHPGHLELIDTAAEIEGMLIVGVNSDESIKMLKGPGKPIYSLRHRLIMLNYLEQIDLTVVINGKRCVDELRCIQPDIVLKGKGYTIDNMCQDERRAIESYGGEIRFMNDCHYPISTSDIIDRCKKCN